MSNNDYDSAKARDRADELAEAHTQRVIQQHRQRNTGPVVTIEGELVLDAMHKHGGTEVFQRSIAALIDEGYVVAVRGGPLADQTFISAPEFHAWFLKLLQGRA